MTSDDDFPRSPNQPPDGELSRRAAVLSEEIRKAMAVGDKTTAGRLARERRGIHHQLRQSHAEWRAGFEAERARRRGSAR